MSEGRIRGAGSADGGAAASRGAVGRKRVARKPRRATPVPLLVGAGEDPRAVLGRVVNERRVALGLSQEDFAARVELDRTYVSGIERGLKNPTLLVLLRIARVLNTSLDALIEAGE